MSYAKIVLGLPVEGPFDYSVPGELAAYVRPGCRVRINFRNKKEIGYIVGVSDKTDIKSVKPLSDVIDKQSPLLSERYLEFTRRLSEYYCCGWGEIIQAAIPEGFRKGKPAPVVPADPSASFCPRSACKAKIVLVHDPDGGERFGIFLDALKKTVEGGRSCIYLAPDKAAVMRVADRLSRSGARNIRVLLRQGRDEAGLWADLRSSRACLVVGTRSAVFAPVSDLGLIIVDSEEEYGYKQDQAPHYHAREAAVIRAASDGADILAGSVAPSLEAMIAVKSGTAELVRIVSGDRSRPVVKIVDMKNLPVVSSRQKLTISGFVADSVKSVLAEKGRVLFFLNRKGFATLAVCGHCGKIYKCPECGVNLIYHAAGKVLRCHYCKFSAAPANICPDCNAGYIRFLGAGTEKLLSELVQAFPGAAIGEWSPDGPEAKQEYDITISSESAIRHAGGKFDLVCAIGVDNLLNYADFRSAERTFRILSVLKTLASDLLLIQTNMMDHHAIKAVEAGDPDIFYSEEFCQRRQLQFPPFRHFAAVKVRGRDEQKAENAARELGVILSGDDKPAGLDIISVAPAIQPKLRGNFYWNILLSCKDPARIHGFLKKSLRIFKRSGIIITVDIDPV